MTAIGSASEKAEVRVAHQRPDTVRAKPDPGTTGLLLVTAIIGYEWFVSGVAKLGRGGFPAGLADELAAKAGELSGWYADFLVRVAIPNAELFGYLIETGEILAGLALMAGPLVWLFAWARLSDRARRAVLLAIAAAAIGGALLAVNLHLANGDAHPWRLPDDPFDEGVDLDSVLVAVQLVIAAVSVVLSRRLRRAPSAGHGATT